MTTALTSRSWRAGAAFVALALAPAALAAQTAPATLTLEQAIAAARENNPEFLQARNDQRVADAGVRASRDAFLPTAQVATNLGYVAEGQSRVGAVDLARNPAVYTSGFSASAGLDLSASKLFQPGVARAQSRATAQRISGVEADLAASVKQLYLTALQAQESVEQAEREVARTTEYVRLAQAKLDVGAGTPLDLRRAEVQLGQAEVALLQARNRVATDRLQLGQALGTMLSTETRLTSNFQVFKPGWNADALVESALRNNPALLAFRANSDAADTQVKSARGAYLPTLSFDVGVNGSALRPTSFDGLIGSAVQGAEQGFAACQRENRINASIGMPTSSCFDPSTPEAQQQLGDAIRGRYDGYPFAYTRQPWQASVTLAIPVLAGPQRRQQIQQARVEREDAELRVRSQELRLRTEVATGLLNVNNAFEVVELQTRVVERASEELRLAQERFRFGASTSLDVVDAQTNLSEAERARIEAVYNFHKSLAALEALVGQPLR